MDAHSGRITDGQQYQDAEFTRIIAQGAQFASIEFDHCHFAQCSFNQSTFSRCTFVECQFDDCDLSLLTLPNTRLLETAFITCKLLGINWTTAGDTTVSKLSFSVRFHESILNYDVFFGMALKRTQFTNCTIHEADFRDADLTEAICTASDFAGSRFHNTNLVKADFRKATNYVIDPTTNAVKKARFSLPEAVSLLRGFDVRVE